MRFLVAAAVAILSLFSGVQAGEINAGNVREEFLRQAQWNDFKVSFGKNYSSSAEESYRYNVFVSNMERAAQLSLENPQATFGVTKFSDMDPAEFKRFYLGYKPEVGTKAVERLSRPVQKPSTHVDAAATDIDWRTKGAVTPVKDQGQCGSCWAFSTTEGVESAWFMKHGELLALSPQQITSCDNLGDLGCNGGDLPTAFEYVQQNGLEGEKDYPYTSGTSGATGSCKFSASKVEAQISGFTYATTPCTGTCSGQDEATLLNNLVSTGPSSICVYADSWQLYVSGVITSTSSCPYSYYSLDHCVQLVGYQTASPNNYWIVRNSWGTSWGQSGYIYLKYGSNVCGVADEATFATSA